MDKELALKTIEIELSQPYVHPDVKSHYEKLREAILHQTHTGLRILIFQPISTGDIVNSSLSAELFQIKYPGCVVDYCIEADVARDLLVGNPFIRDIIVTRNWDLVRKRDSLEFGALAKEYDMIYSLYWWDAKPNMITSWFKDLELPTDYTRVRIYTRDYHEETADEVLKDYKKPIIMLQSDMKNKWGNKEKYEELKSRLKMRGGVTVVESEGKHITYGVTAAMLKRCDMFVGAHGSLEHVAAAVGCQTVTLSTVYDPSYVMVPFYQNKYLPDNKKCLVVRPKDFCGDYHCISHVPSNAHYKQPPYGFSGPHTPPHKYRPCDYKGFKDTCIHEITVDDIMEVVEKAYELRKL